MTNQNDSESSQASANFATKLWRRLGPVATELGLVVVLYSIYSILRSASPDRYSLAMGHSFDIEKLENALGINVELGLNELFVRHQWLADFGSYWYQIAHMLVTASVLIWMWRRRRPQYKVMRTGLAIVMLAGLATYWLYPLAPPRFALTGAVDTMNAHPVLFWGDNVTGLANLYAAMPSLHVAWAFWCALTVVLLNSSKWKHLAWLYPAMMAFVVMGTANHYVLDALAGVLYTTVAVAVSRWLYGVTSPNTSRVPLGA